MSRTYKDRSYRMRLMDNMKAGKIDHDHREPRSDWTRYRKDIPVINGYRVGAHQFMEHEGKDLVAFKEYLTENNVQFTEEVSEMEKTGTYFRRYAQEELDEMETYTREYTAAEWAFFERLRTRNYNKTVKVIRVTPFVLKKGRYRSDESEFCTDAEHFDPVTQTDTRDGKSAKCSPSWDGVWHYRKFGKRYNAASRSGTRQAAWKAVKEHRAGCVEGDYDNIDLYEMRFSFFGCGCC